MTFYVFLLGPIVLIFFIGVFLFLPFAFKHDQFSHFDSIPPFTTPNPVKQSKPPLTKREININNSNCQHCGSPIGRLHKSCSYCGSDL